MHKLKKEKQMDILLLQHKVTGHDMQQLAKKIASFHTTTTIIYKKNYLDIQEKFNDLEFEKEYLGGQLGQKSSDCIKQVIEISNAFLKKHTRLLDTRLHAGFFRDCHGDLHSRNIFLLPEPVPFDCIEFNDDLRQIDVLNEVAFLCMDLEAMGRQDLSALFIEHYNKYFPAMAMEEDRALFIYYKSYRANIRAKVYSLRAKSAEPGEEKSKALSMADQYLTLMESYTRQLEI
jgi:aminoglycoside phosphotransferase family enzyme